MKEITLVHVSASYPRTVPTGTLYIAAVLKKAGYAIDFRDFGIDSYRTLDPTEIYSVMRDGADFVGVSCMSDTLPFVLCAVRKFKKEQPGKIVILGGPGPSGVAEELVRTFPFIDVVVVGEGEETIVEVMDCLTTGARSDLASVGGICYRDGDCYRRTPPRERIADLDGIPLPLYECIRLEDYPLVNIVFSRGCPYGCTFCDVARLWQRKNRRRSVESVVEEMKFLRNRYGRVDFEFSDETFVLREDVVSGFCRRLRSDRLEIGWACSGRINLMTPELLEEMVASGCRGVFYGIESASDAVLRRIRKDFTIAAAVDVLHMTSRHARTVASFIWGFPFESDEDLLRTLYLAVYLSQVGVDVRLNRLVPFALTPLYREYGDRLVLNDAWRSASAMDPFDAGRCCGEVRELVTSMPRLFPEYYWFQTDRLREKSEIVCAIDRYRHVQQWPKSCGCAKPDASETVSPGGGGSHAGS